MPAAAAPGDRFIDPQPSLSEAVLQLRDVAPPSSSQTKDITTISTGGIADDSRVASPTSRAQTPGTRFPPAANLDTVSTEEYARSTPKDRLNALLSSGKGGASSGSASRSARSTPSPTLSSRPGEVSANRPPTSNPAATQTQTQMSVKSQQGHGVAVRGNVSLDTAPSAAGNAQGDSPVSAQDTSPSSTAPVDTNAYIASHGSVHAALEKSLAQRQALTTKNDKLWKLVEKQREMILNYKQDLDRALQDKERYRRKMKEMQAMPPPPVPPLDASSSKSSKSQSHAHKKSDASDVTAGPLSPRLPPDLQSTSQSASQAQSKTVRIQDAPVTRAKQGGVSEYKPRLSEESNVSASKAGLSSPKTPTAAGVSMTSPSMSSPAVSSPGERARKAAPKPLDLSNARPTLHSAKASQTTVEDDSGSDYEAVLNENGQAASPIERGRRRTREDDDDAREKMAIEEEERRSASEKEGSASKIKKAVVASPPMPLSKPTAIPAGLQAAVGLPASPRAPMLGGLQSPLQPNMGSIASAFAAPRPAPSLAAAPPPPPASTRTTTTSNTQSSSSSAPQAASIASLKQEAAQLPMKSPGLPMSPRPGDRPPNAPPPRLPNQSIASPGPMSPKSGMLFSPRPPRGKIPLPGPNLWGPEGAENAGGDSQQSSNHNLAPLTEVYRGFATEQYPNLLLPPNALPFITVNVYSSRLRPSRQSLIVQKGFEDDPGFLLAINSRADNRQLWRVEKTVSLFTALDRTLRATGGSEVPSLNNRTLFSGHSPAQIDARRATLNQYFDVILDSHLTERAAFQVCEFLSTEVLPPQVDVDLGRAGRSAEDVSTESSVSTTQVKATRRKEGYLSKKGKQFGGWKARYFVIDGSELRYYEAPGAQYLGYIKLSKAHVARQVEKDSDPDGEFRHAFVILEPKRKDSSTLVQHILCAESDVERDGWVESIQSCIGLPEKTSPGAEIKNPLAAQKTHHHGPSNSASNSRSIQSVSYETTEAAQAPIMGTPEESSSLASTPASPESALTSPPASSPNNHPNISGPVGGGPIQNTLAWGNKASPSLGKDSKKRNMFGFKSKSTDEQSGNKLPPSPVQHVNEHLNQHLARRQAPVRPVFGMPLADAAEHCPPFGIDLLLPAPVYRSIEYLQARNAAQEEGIFRLSGSNTLIKSLRERFNAEGDVKLLDGTHYDVHAVASLLKLYLRELPDPVLSRDLHLEFLRTLEVEDKQTKMNSVNVLVHRLPEANLELLKTLSQFLNEIVSNSDVNKMTVRNVGIVFSPTLNIPAPLISLFLTDYHFIFNDIVDPSTSPVADSSPTTPGAYDDFRSPRKQMFTDLSSPGPTQSTFPGMQPVSSSKFPSPDPRQQYDTGFVPVPVHTPHHPQPQSATFHTVQPPSLAQVVDTGGFSSLNAFLAPATLPPPPVPTPSPGPPPGFAPPDRASLSSSGSGASLAHASGAGIGAGKGGERASSTALGHTPSNGSSASSGSAQRMQWRDSGSVEGRRKGSAQKAGMGIGMGEVREE